MTEQLFLIKWMVRVPFLSVGQINVYSIYRFQCVSFSFSINIVHILKRLDKKIIILIDQILFFFFFPLSEEVLSEAAGEAFTVLDRHSSERQL